MHFREKNSNLRTLINL